MKWKLTPRRFWTILAGTWLLIAILTAQSGEPWVGLLQAMTGACCYFTGTTMRRYDG